MEPRDRINYTVSEGRDEYTFITFEEALDIIKRLDAITYGMPKIVYLTGWQSGGHDGVGNTVSGAAVRRC